MDVFHHVFLVVGIFEDVGRANDPQRNVAHVFHSAQGACKLALGPYVTGIYIEVHGSGVES